MPRPLVPTTGWSCGTPDAGKGPAGAQLLPLLSSLSEYTPSWLRDEEQGARAAGPAAFPLCTAPGGEARAGPPHLVPTARPGQFPNGRVGATLGEWGGPFLLIRGGGANKAAFLEGEWQDPPQFKPT